MAAIIAASPAAHRRTRPPPAPVDTLPVVPSTDANGIAIYYELTGEGRPDGSNRLLCISGTGGDLRQEPKMSDAFADTFEVLAYDQRGLGQTDVPEGPYTMADYADDAAALVAAVGWDDCAVVGISFGGMVAQELAIRHPGRVRRLALCCTSAGGAGGASYPLQELADRGPEEGPALHLQLMDVRWDEAWRAANPDMASMIIERFASSAATPGAGQRLQLEARSHHDTSDRLATIGCPTLVAGGLYDGIAPPKNSEFLANAIPGAQLRLFDGGHGFFLQDPEAIPAIVDFLATTVAP
jgi:3-oxoadipate enol-lactonase